MTTTPPTTTYRLALPWDRPPLNANQRPHWTTRHRLTADIRTTVAWLAKAARVPPTDHCTVTLIWAPGDHRRRDVDNLVATLKPCADGLVDAGIVPDDHHQSRPAAAVPALRSAAPGHRRRRPPWVLAQPASTGPKRP